MEQNEENERIAKCWPELTPRYAMIATAISLGLERQTIAKTLGVVLATYDSARDRILTSLGLENNVQLCLEAVRRGAVRLDKRT